MTTEVFIVGWTIDYGFRLFEPPGDGDEIMPVFATEEAEAAFSLFFNAEAVTSPKYVEKKTYCRCAGKRRKIDEQTEFIIDKAELFAR